jgi:hypothetical protein
MATGGLLHLLEHLREPVHRLPRLLAHYVLLDVGASRCFYVSVSQDGLDGLRIFTKFVILWQVSDEIHANLTNIVP